MILHMIQLNPNARLSFQSYLQNYASSIFPSHFSPSLHKFFSCLVPLDSDARVAAIERAFHKIHAQMMSVRSSDDVIIDSSESPKLTDEKGFQNIKGATQSMLLVRGDSRSRSGKNTIAGQVQPLGDFTSLLRDIEQINCSTQKDVTQKNGTILSTDDSDTDCTRFSRQSWTLKDQPSNDPQGHKQKDLLCLRNILKGDLDSLTDVYDSQTDTYHMPCFPGSGDKNSCDGMVLIASLVCSCIRSVKQPQLRRGWSDPIEDLFLVH